VEIVKSCGDGIFTGFFIRLRVCSPVNVGLNSCARRSNAFSKDISLRLLLREWAK